MEILVEDARLNFVRSLHGKGFVHCQNGLIGAGCDVERVEQPEQGSTDGDDGGDADEVADAEAGGAHGDDFAVGGQAAESEQDTDEHGHGNGDHEEVGKEEENDFKDALKGGAVADDGVEDFGEFLHEKDEGEQCATDEGVGEDLAEDVTG